MTPVMFLDSDGHSPKWYNPFSWFDNVPDWGKWVIGGLAFAGAVGLTILSGGALAPVFIGMGVSIASGGLINGAITAANGGSFWSGFASGAADGALWGGIFSLVSAGIGAIKYTKGFRGVGLDEFDDIANTGQFAASKFAEGKYFWTTKANAQTFAKNMGLADDAFRIVGTRISRNALKSAVSSGNAFIWTSANMLDNIGRAYFMHMSVVNQITKRIWVVL